MISKSFIDQGNEMQMQMHALSCIPWKDNPEVTKLDTVTVRATMTKAEDPCLPLGKENVISLAAQFFAPDYAPKMTPGEWRKEQEKDVALKKVINLLETNTLFEFRSGRNDTPDLQNYLKIRKSLVLVQGLLHRKVQLKHHPMEVHQFVLPFSFRKRVVLACS